jgi:hypothetical protein
MTSVIRANIWQNSAGTTYNSVLNVYTANKTNTQATVGGGWVDISGLSITLVPRFSTSRFLIFYSVTMGMNVQHNQMSIRLVRNGSLIAIGDADGSRERVTAGTQDSGAIHGATYCMTGQFLDSPATVSAVEYKIQFRCEGSVTAWINRGNEADGDSIVTQRCYSNITVMEMAA